MYDKIKNPITNRYVSINGVLGKKILKNYLNTLSVQTGGFGNKADVTLLLTTTFVPHNQS